MKDVITLTADHEKPMCSRCDSADNDKYCTEMCGSKHDWWRYQRTISIEENTDESNN